MFFTKIVSRNFSHSTVIYGAIKNVTVIGSGLMGAGIAQVAAQSGHNVIMVDVDKNAVTKAQERISTSLRRVAKTKFSGDTVLSTKFIDDSLAKLKTSTDIESSLSEADLVIEAIIENLDMKKNLFSKIDKIAPSHTIFASNTSSLAIKNIAQPTSRKDRFGGLHFFNPVPVMQLLEVIRIPETSQDTFDSLITWGKAIGKVTVECKDTPGFIVNRLLIPYQQEATHMLERGDASARDIDTAMKLGAGYKLGPFELADYVGLDTSLFIIEGWAKDFPDNPLFEVSPHLKKMVEEGKLGIKSGEGYYKYGKK